MAIDIINLGTYANDGTGDDLRTAFDKVNGNTDYLNLVKIETGANVGGGNAIYKSTVGTTLNFKTIVQGSNIFISSAADTITITTPDSINALEEDPNPKLANNLDLNGYEIFNTTGSSFESVLINGFKIDGSNYSNAGTVVLQSRFTKDNLKVYTDQILTLESDANQISMSGNTTINGDLTNSGVTTLIGNGILEDTLSVKGGEVGDQLTVRTSGSADDGIIISSYNYDKTDLSALILSGNQVSVTGGNLTVNENLTVVNTITASDIVVTNGITVDTDILVYGMITAANLVGTLNGNVIGNVTGNLTGNVTGNVTGNLTGNVTGTVSSISNHSLYELNNVNVVNPVAGQVLKYNGTSWINGTDNTGGGTITEINTFDFGNFKNIFTNPTTYLLNQVGVDFGSFTAPSQFTVDLGSF
jgi:hypothetical protein